MSPRGARRAPPNGSTHVGIQNYEVVIVGGGPAGMTAGLYAGRSMLKTVVLERGAPGGELLNTEMIEDYPGFEHVEGWDLAQKFANHAAKFGAEFHTRNVQTIKRQDDGTFHTTCDDGEVYVSPTVIVTAGGTPIKLGIPGEAEYAGKGVSYCAVCDGAFFKGHTIAVVGGGDAACEEADYLTRFAPKVYLIHRRDSFRASKIVQKRVFENPKIEVIWNTVVEQVHGDAQGLVDHISLRDVITGATRDLAVTGFFVFIGFKPNTGVVKGHFKHDPGGYFITDDHMMSSITGLFAAGDVRAQLTRQVTTAVGDATTAAIAVAKFVADLKAKEPVGAA
ncbi:MAG TPA: thioredoxin-disulfide reductase, partial [Gemmatimonadaceae bacterium]|nr:thioredoxin-disulfide reductase [Gemmatimonadaceae bacterium]